MGVTAIKRIVNQSFASATLLNLENRTSPGHGVLIRPGESVAVDIWVPWAPRAEDFPQRHLQLQVNGQTRFWIWQAANADGDFVRFSVDGTWHDQGERVYGLAGVDGDRMLVVLDGLFVLTYQLVPQVLPNVTAIKRVENRSRATVTLLNQENTAALGHGVRIDPGQSLAVAMWVPWATQSHDFQGHHLRVQLNDQTRFWIWQAARADGDFVRFSVDGVWRDPGQRVPGISTVGIPLVDVDRTLVVLDDRFELVARPQVTTLKRIDNRSRRPVTLLSAENPRAPGHGVVVQPGQSLTANLWIPWAPRSHDFPQHNLQVQLDGQTRFWIWQAAGADGNLVRFSTNGSWHVQAERAHGLSGVQGDRSIVVLDDRFELVAQTPFGIGIADLRGLLGMSGHRFADTQPGDPRVAGVPSVPKATSTAFSMAGTVSDAYDRGTPDARYLYRDSGKRYAFKIENGVVIAEHADAPPFPLTDAISYDHRRAGQRGAAPAFDLVAASGGRVFAKARGSDRFYFATMDHLFVHADDHGYEFVVPSTYFKLDPEFNAIEAKTWDLTAHLAGILHEHPAAERFPQLFWPLIEQRVMDAMIVRLERRVWHLIDTRPPLSRFSPDIMAVEVVRRLLADVLYPPGGLAPVLDAFKRWLIDDVLGRYKQTLADAQDPAAEMAPPAFVPTYDHVAYQLGDATPIRLSSIRYERVLDIGVGHVHHHEQFERITGGELQPIRSAAPWWPFSRFEDFAYLYRLANGPLRDGDGHIDGTCNFYLLVQLKQDAALAADRRDGFGLLFIDEQSYFTRRWRLVHPEDYKGLSLALIKGLREEPQRYQWNPATYWCPFRAGAVGRRSRLAVAAQVLLVSGDPEAGFEGVYSINFSYSSMDRTWRWRRLPAAGRYFADDAALVRESIGATEPNTVYPQTLRLREDMTLHLKGTRHKTGGGVEVGRWYQRYLPATNRMTPAAAELIPGERPRTGYTHPWKFLPEAVFQRADRWSHFGVYDQVDSRTQYYRIDPVTATDAAELAKEPSGPWIDEGNQLLLGAWRFPWHGGQLEYRIKRPPSIFNRRTRLRIVRRGSFGWIATHADKRDDDLMPFEGLPMTVELTQGTRRARVIIRSNVWVEEPPVVRSAEFSWSGEPNTAAVIALSTPQEQRDLDASRTALLKQTPDAVVFENIWRVRMAALDPTRPTGVVSLLDTVTEGRFTRNGSRYEFRWLPTTAEAAELRRYCTGSEVLQYGTSIWFEDLVGHVAVPEDVRWLPPPTIRAAATPQSIPLGVAVQLTIHAQDLRTGAGLAGTVMVDGQVVGKTGTAFTYTFISQVERVYDPELGIWIREERFPVVTVSAPDYLDAEIPLSFYKPLLRLRVEPASLPIGRAVQLTIHAADATTGAAVAGRVTINGQDVASTQTAFTYTFTSVSPTVVVMATGYPDARAAGFLYMPQLSVSVEPSPILIGRVVQVTVRAVDRGTGQAVAGRVKLNGQDVGATNSPITYTFGSTPPSGVVSAPYYADAAITWPPLRHPQLNVAVQPYPVPMGQATSVIVRATDMYTGAAVDGTVNINGAVVARTNVAFTYTFMYKRVRQFDAETRTYYYELIPPVGTVIATGYPDTTIDLGV